MSRKMAATLSMATAVVAAGARGGNAEAEKVMRRDAPVGFSNCYVFV